jgi:tRNA threonylcarbamoyladenosine modification (KEOPS) complex  Pcc1 subunit
MYNTFFIFYMAGIFVCSYHAISVPVQASDVASVDATLNAVKHLLWYQMFYPKNLCFEWKASDVASVDATLNAVEHLLWYQMF